MQKDVLQIGKKREAVSTFAMLNLVTLSIKTLHPHHLLVSLQVTRCNRFYNTLQPRKRPLPTFRKDLVLTDLSLGGWINIPNHSVS
jgi:hypothetical protein